MTVEDDVPQDDVQAPEEVGAPPQSKKLLERNTATWEREHGPMLAALRAWQADGN